MKQSFLLGVQMLIVLSLCMSMAVYSESVRLRPDTIDTSTVVTSNGRDIIVSYRTQQKKIPLNQIHSWNLTLTNRQGEPIEGMAILISTTMPEHIHGMATKPRFSRLDTPGEYLLEGMNFHMPGWWEITLEISGNGINDTALFNLLVGESM